MLRLFLLRHAKSSWSDPSLHDFDRPLNKRGKSDAPRVGAAMKERGYHPDRILCSSSLRTKETLAGVIPSLTGDVSLRLLDSLYEGNAPDYIVHLRAHAHDSQNLLIVGHNTGLQATALRLAGFGDRTVLADMHHKYPTGALAVIEFAIERWDEIEEGTGRLVDFIKPRDLKPRQDEVIVENPAPTFFRR